MKQQLYNVVLVAVGYILSPLSWWNDLFVNLPLSYLLSWPFSLIDDSLFLPAFVFIYWLTNLAGLLMMHWGGHNILNQDRAAFSIKKSLLVSLVYTGIIIVFAWQGWLISSAELLEYIK